MDNSYNNLASIYDRLMPDFNYDYIIDCILSDNLYKSGLDLASGTGISTIKLAQRGISMIGVDKNINMLNEAHKNMRKHNLVIPFIKSDILKLKLDKKFNLITIICDGVNYIEGKHLTTLFSQVYSMLQEGGLFAFDISTGYKLKNVIGNNIFYEDMDEFTYLWTNKLNNDCVDMDLTIFVNNNENVYKRYDEHHRQYIHSEQDILSALKNSNFNNISVQDGECAQEHNEKSNRILIKCRK